MCFNKYNWSLNHKAEKMIYLNTVNFAPQKQMQNKNFALHKNTNQMHPILFGSNPTQKTSSAINIKKILKNITDVLFPKFKTVESRDKFGKKVQETFKNNELIKKILFKNKDGQDIPHIIIKYKKGKMKEATELQVDGRAANKTLYSKTGEKTQIQYGIDGKSKAIFGL